jgi:hypothetical protein
MEIVLKCISDISQERRTFMVYKMSRAVFLTPQYLKDSEFDDIYVHYTNVILKIHITDTSAGQE